MSAAQPQQTQQNQADPGAEAAAPEQTQETDSAPVGPAATPLVSLDSLLGGALESASNCTVDGTCD